MDHQNSKPLLAVAERRCGAAFTRVNAAPRWFPLRESVALFPEPDHFASRLRSFVVHFQQAQSLRVRANPDWPVRTASPESRADLKKEPYDTTLSSRRHFRAGNAIA